MTEEDPLDTQEFNELMQRYRHAPLADQQAVIEAYDAVKAYLRTHDVGKRTAEAVEGAAALIRVAGFTVDTVDGFPLVRPPASQKEKRRLIETLARLGFSFTITADGVAVYPS